MSLTLDGSTTSYVGKGVVWNGGSFDNEMSRERRAQLAAEAETAFRARCSAFLAATVEMVRHQCEMCLTEAVENALQRYSTLLQDTLQLSNGSADGKTHSSADEDYVDIKMEDNTSIVEITGESYESKTDLGVVSGSIQLTAPTDAALADYELDDYDSVVAPATIFGIEMNADKKEEFSVKAERLLDSVPSNLNAMVSTQPPQSVGHTCEQCGRSFTRKSHLIRHRLIHTGERPYDCHLCHRRFSQKVHLTSHLLTHAGSEDLHRAPINTGEQTHSTSINVGERPYDCHFCHRRFSKIAHLMSHLRTHNETQNPQSGPELPLHFPSSQPTGWPSSTTLPQDPVPLISPSRSTESKLTPTTPRRHRCHDCGKYFTRSSHLSRHRLIHTGERPHVCDICRKAFSQKVHLQAHLKRHNQDVFDSGLSSGGGFLLNVHEAGTELQDGNQDYVKRSP